MNDAARMHVTALLAAGVMHLAATSPAAAQLPLSLSTGFGPAWAAGAGSDRLDRGRGGHIDATRPAVGGHWLVRVAYDRLQRVGTATAYGYASDGRVYLPSRDVMGDRDWSFTNVEAGWRRESQWGAFRPFIETLAGAAYVRQDRAGAPAVVNDRRPDLTPPVSLSFSTAAAPSFGAGAGFELRGPARIGLTVAVAARWTALRELSGPVVPLTAGLGWPAEAPSVEHASAGDDHTPRMRASAGGGALRVSRKDLPGRGGAFAIAIDVPLRAGLALSLAGEQSEHDNGARVVLRQDRDEFGNLVNVYGRSLSFTATAVTLGARVSRTERRVTPSLRAGVGWGRTGGFGETYRVVDGATLDASGAWVPLTHEVDAGGGAPRSGFALSAELGADIALRGRLALTASAGVLNLWLDHHDVRGIPLRLGLAM